jgi:hypothetical protein
MTTRSGTVAISSGMGRLLPLKLIAAELPHAFELIETRQIRRAFALAAGTASKIIC